MKHRSARWLAAAICVACTSTEQPAGVRTSAIVNGTIDDGDVTVCGMYVEPGWMGCTGMLVGSRVVLTAAHCTTSFVPGATNVFFGSDYSTGGTVVGITDMRRHPDFWRLGDLYNDVALIVLAAPAHVAPSAALPAGPLDPKVGDVVRIVGFGQSWYLSEDAADRRKREGTMTITEVADTWVRAEPGPSITCTGDSGGPVFLDVGGTERLLGVVSMGDVECATYTKISRVDVYVESFVRPFLDATEPGSRQVGERCFYEGNCAEGTCFSPADAPKIRYCSAACAGDEGCPAPMRCVESACRYPEPSPGAMWTECEQSYDCDSGECLRQESSGPSICSQSCVEPDLPCPDGYECLPTDREQGVDGCFPETGCDCRVGGRGEASASALALAALLLALRGRPRRRRARPIHRSPEAR